MVGFFQQCGRLGIVHLNLGIVLGFTFGALILLRPVTGRLLRPKHQVWLWFAGWYVGFLSQIYDILGRRVRIPFSFRDLVIPRVQELGRDRAMPLYILDEAGEGPTLLLPGGVEASLPDDVFETFLVVIGVIWIVAFVAALIWYNRQERRLRELGRQGEKMDRETMAKYGILQDNVVVRLCEGLPASFVRFGHEEGVGDGVRFVICLQKELPEQQLRLVLLHEMEHIRLHHAWYKSIVVGGLTIFYWWNPVMWLAYRLTCRDMELACDEAVLEKLELPERREYAHTLVELGSGRHMWGNLTSFGECDAALRVRRAAAWKRWGENRTGLSVMLVVVLLLFFYCGGPVSTSGYVDATTEDWNAYYQSMAWVEETQEFLENSQWQPKEIWSRAEERLLVLDMEDRWYSLGFYWNGEEYYLGRATPMERAFHDDYTRLG